MAPRQHRSYLLACALLIALELVVFYRLDALVEAAMRP